MPYITSIERWGRQEGHREGRREGCREGRQEGRREEAANLVTRLLQKRFPELPEKELQLIRRLPLRKLEKLGEALLDFQSADEVRSWMAGA